MFYLVTPTILPGIILTKFSLTAKNAACGPPQPSGTPNRWEFPRATSTPNSPGGFKIHKAKRSVAQQVRLQEENKGKGAELLPSHQNSGKVHGK